MYKYPQDYTFPRDANDVPPLLSVRQSSQGVAIQRNTTITNHSSHPSFSKKHQSKKKVAEEYKNESSDEGAGEEEIATSSDEDEQ